MHKDYDRYAKDPPRWSPVTWSELELEHVANAALVFAVDEVLAL